MGVGEKDADAEALCPAASEACECVCGGKREGERDSYDDHADDGGVDESTDETGALEKQVQVF